ncbi:beta-galactosidase [Candidatus Xianfuyuplasma coldseepsis]|uniref:Glycosyl hydrolase n=1 Tax=Candidatus Xianfuyuplasma coldseepsis TaxID=2782163 RepID=A0A7L7KTH1_9MOLU|nr:beta-galactosidase [Xianfuyuplasma coldseepsis]QMS85058.1 glycosyl hydrolase [Xianfuyuplasma coldseepsis]
MSITYHKKQFLIDGKPRLLLFAEFHYYRTSPDKWQEKIDLIKASGVHGIASYIPWLIHEYHENDFDFEGRYHPENNLIGFLDLIAQNDLYFIARPGPFIMAEMKNDGIPFWVYEKYPDVVPVSWFNKPSTTVTLDYLAPDFLRLSKRYYSKVIPIISKHQYPEGNTLAIQLDNEIGMLPWVSNNPDLTDNVLTDFYQYLVDTYDHHLGKRYSFIHTPMDDFIEHVRFPQQEYVHKLHQDLGQYNRIRYSRYVEYLADYATEYGFDKGLFVINIHGCSAGRAVPYPIGISQLYQSYRNKPRFISGSDHYLRDVDVPHFTDAYILNRLTEASNGEDQPLTSLEFSAGDGDYGNSYSSRYKTSRIDFMTRMFVALNNRILNYYSFVGGRNYRLEDNLDDGNNRIATTGEEHGFAAPISPNGEKSYTWLRMQDVMHLVRAHENHLATQSLVDDGLEYVFDPDYFMTEYHTPNLDNEIFHNLEMHRSWDMWDNVLKPLLLLNYHFKATNIKDDPLTPQSVLLVPSARFMSQESQQKIVNHLQQGGKMILFGEVPQYDLEYNPCTLIQDYLELKNPHYFEPKGYRFRPSIIAKNLAEGRAELHRNYYQTFSVENPSSVFFEVYHNHQACGFHIKKDMSESIVITTRYRADLELYKRFMDTLGVSRHMHHDYELYHGIFMAKTVNDDGVEYNHLLNLDDFDKSFTLHDDKEYPIVLESGRALLMAKNLPISTDTTVLYSTNELVSFDSNEITIQLMGPSFTMEIESTRNIICDDPYVEITKQGTHYVVHKQQRLYDETVVKIQIQ